MKQRALLLMFAITTVMMLAAPTLRAAVPFVIPIVATDDSGNTRTLAIGILATANACVDTADQYSGYQEYELPPTPPTNVFDARLDDKSGAPNTPCYGQGTATDFRPVVGPGQVDTFLVKTQDGTGGRPIHLSWPAGLSSVADSCKILDQFGGFLINVDMLTSTNYDLTIGLPSSFYVILYPTIAPNTPVYFTSLTPDQVFNEDPFKPGKSKKGIKRFKGLGMPNFTNLLDETVVQGGFQSGTSESDVAGGMVVGTAQMDNLGGKFKPNKAYAAIHRWGRFSKWDAIKLKGKSFADIQKTLKDKTGSHIGIARGFDSTGNPGDIKRKLLVKQKKLVPKEQSNRLFAELVAAKVNIAASAIGKTPVGFGELLYVRPGHPYDGWAITAITDRLDSVMTFWAMIGPNGGGEWDSAYNALFEINRAFDAPALDTLSWETGGKCCAKLSVKGNIDVNTISYLAMPSPFVPTIVTPTNNDWESEEDFEDQDEYEIDGVPSAMKLYQNYPNPFNPSTTIGFRLGTAANVSIKIFDVLGQEVASVLENEDMDEGFQSVDFSAANLSSGIYFYRVEGQSLENGERIQPAVGKMMLLK